MHVSRILHYFNGLSKSVRRVLALLAIQVTFGPFGTLWKELRNAPGGPNPGKSQEGR